MTDHLSNNDVHDLLEEARRIFDERSAQTIEGSTAIKAARRAMVLLQLGLLRTEITQQLLEPWPPE
jgi:hypothetical protein